MLIKRMPDRSQRVTTKRAWSRYAGREGRMHESWYHAQAVSRLKSRLSQMQSLFHADQAKTVAFTVASGSKPAPGSLTVR